MYGLTRAGTTLIAVAFAGFLFWVGTRIVDPLNRTNGLSAGDFWLWMATLAAAGFVIALSQLLGGWTKWGWPRISAHVFFVAFIPALFCGLWILFFHQPGTAWLPSHIRSWSNDIGIDRLVSELGITVPVIGFALGLLFGLTFDTTGPRVVPVTAVAGGQAPAAPAGPDVAGEGYAGQVHSPDELEQVHTPADDGDQDTVAGGRVTPTRD
jgi:hypothetical protein